MNVQLEEMLNKGVTAPTEQTQEQTQETVATNIYKQKAGRKILAPEQKKRAGSKRLTIPLSPENYDYIYALKRVKNIPAVDVINDIITATREADEEYKKIASFLKKYGK